MARFNILLLNYITSSAKLNTFNLTYSYITENDIDPDFIKLGSLSAKTFNRTLFGDVGLNESMSDSIRTNLESMYDISNNRIIHNLYLLNDIRFRSSLLKNNRRNLSADDHVDYTLPSLSNDFIAACQFNGYTYALALPTTSGPYILKLIEQDIKNDYTYTILLSNNVLKTYFYPTPELISLYDRFLISNVLSTYISTYSIPVFDAASMTTMLSGIDTIMTSYVKVSIPLSDAIKHSYNDVLSANGISVDYGNLSSIFDPNINVENIMYNYVLEIPENQYYNQYYNGDILANSIVCKNAFDTTYSMNAKRDDTNNRVAALFDCREYCGIDKCGNSLYLKYRDNINYDIGLYELIYSDSTDGVSALTNLDGTPLMKATASMRDKKYTYLHIETIGSITSNSGINRLSPDINHKSNLYSLRINNIGINNNPTIPEKIKDKIKQDIRHNVRKMAEKITPANTLLFEIYFSGN